MNYEEYELKFIKMRIFKLFCCFTLRKKPDTLVIESWVPPPPLIYLLMDFYNISCAGKHHMEQLLRSIGYLIFPDEETETKPKDIL